MTFSFIAEPKIDLMTIQIYTGSIEEAAEKMTLGLRLKVITDGEMASWIKVSVKVNLITYQSGFNPWVGQFMIKAWTLE